MLSILRNAHAAQALPLLRPATAAAFSCGVHPPVGLWAGAAAPAKNPKTLNPARALWAPPPALWAPPPPAAPVLRSACLGPRFPAAAIDPHRGFSAGPTSNEPGPGVAVDAALPEPGPGVDPGAEEPPMRHPGSPGNVDDDSNKSYMLMHPVYSKEYVESVAPKHKKPQKVHEYLAYYAIQSVRFSFDKVTGYGHDNMTMDKWMTRTIFLETVAGVPGMVAGMLRHMSSLRSMQRDHGWIHTLLEEAENERMHLLTFLQIRQPGPIFRTMVLLGQGVMFNAYLLLYILFPKTCHSAVGYLEEEAVKTYTHLIQDVDAGRVPEWKDTPCPDIARQYWRLEESATMRDMFLAIRADEACHSYVNHTFSELDQKKDKNPFSTGSHAVP